MHMSKRVVILLAALLLCASCQKFAEGKEMFRELLALRDAVSKHVGERVSDINLRGDTIEVAFTDSTLNTASKEAKQQRADEVARFVMLSYRHPVKRVTTTFVTKNGPLKTSETFEGHPPAKPLNP